MDNISLDKTNCKYFLKEIDNLTWKDFEDFVISIFKRIFNTINVKIIHTPYSHDGGKDGEGVLNAFPQYNVNDLNFQVKIWIEVKKRSTKVTGHDIGIHALSAFLNKVSLIVFASNASFDPQVYEILESLCNNHNINHYLIDGRKLFLLYQKYEKNDNIVQNENVRLQSFSAKISFSKHSLRQYSNSRIFVNLYEPFYIFVDFNIEYLTEIVEDYKIVSDSIKLVPYRNIPSLPQATALNCKKITHIWIGLPKKEIREGNIRIELSGISIIQKGINIEKTLFTLEPIGKIKEYIEKLNESVDIWRNDSFYQTFIIYGNAGTGKSFIINNVRHHWLIKNISEILLDGEIENSESLLLNRFIQEIFPITNGMFKEEQKDDLYDFLSKYCQLSYNLSKKLADVICTKGTIDIKEFSSDLLADLLYFLLKEKSEAEKIIIVYEDIHKCQPSVIHLLLKIHKRLLNERNENVFLILSSRKSSSFSQNDIIENWIYYMEQLLTDQYIHPISIEPYTTEEAKFIIHQTVIGLNDIDAYNIIKQVGTTPFGVREAMLYMYQKKWIYFDDNIQGFVFERNVYQNFRQAVVTNAFIQSTKYRLLELKDIIPFWALSFLDIGACLGSSFSKQWCLKTLNHEISEQEFLRILSILNKLGILNISNTYQEYLKFDHDLIRLVILQNQGEIKFKELSRSLFNIIPEESECYKQKAFLAFQASLPDDAMHYSEIYGDLSTRNGIYEDALEAYKMCVSIVDYNLFSGLRLSNVSLWFIDDALNIAKNNQTFPDITIEKRNRKLLQLCHKIVDVAIHIGSGCQEIVEQFINEGLLLSKFLNDMTAKGVFYIRYGILLFDKKDVKKSIGYFKKALDFLPASETYNRADALVQLAISLRHCGLKKESFNALKEALKQCKNNDYEIKLRVFANAGSLYYNIDWNYTKRYWEKALKIAEHSNNIHFWAHMLIDLGQLYLLENNFETAERYYSIAYQKASISGVKSQEFRINLHRSILALINCKDDFSTQLKYAELLILQAENLGILYANERRLWRVYANWANLLELKLKLLNLTLEEKKKILNLMYIYDKRALSEFKEISINDHNSIGILTNIYMRIHQCEYLNNDFLKDYSKEIIDQIITLYNQISKNRTDSIPRNLIKFIKPLLGLNRFIFP